MSVWHLSEMSSWYVERLLLDRHEIRSRLFENSDNSTGFRNRNENYTDPYAFSDDTYLDLLEVESKIKELFNKSLFNANEFTVLQLILDGNTITDIINLTGMSKRMVSTTYKRLCGKIAFYLGGHFTNEGYASYMIDKYNLNEEQIKILKEELYSKIRLRR